MARAAEPAGTLVAAAAVADADAAAVDSVAVEAVVGVAEAAWFGGMATAERHSLSHMQAVPHSTHILSLHPLPLPLLQLLLPHCMIDLHMLAGMLGAVAVDCENHHHHRDHSNTPMED